MVTGSCSSPPPSSWQPPEEKDPPNQSSSPLPGLKHLSSVTRKFQSRSDRRHRAPGDRHGGRGRVFLALASAPSLHARCSGRPAGRGRRENYPGCVHSSVSWLPARPRSLCRHGVTKKARRGLGPGAHGGRPLRTSRTRGPHTWSVQGERQSRAPAAGPLPGAGVPAPAATPGPNRTRRGRAPAAAECVAGSRRERREGGRAALAHGGESSECRSDSRGRLRSTADAVWSGTPTSPHGPGGRGRCRQAHLRHVSPATGTAGATASTCGLGVKRGHFFRCDPRRHHPGAATGQVPTAGPSARPLPGVPQRCHGHMTPGPRRPSQPEEPVASGRGPRGGTGQQAEAEDSGLKGGLRPAVTCGCNEHIPLAALPRGEPGAGVG